MNYLLILHDKSHTGQKEWDDLQSLKKQQETELRKLYDALGLDYDVEQEKEEKKKIARKKRKSSGMRKKGWIPM